MKTPPRFFRPPTIRRKEHASQNQDQTQEPAFRPDRPGVRAKQNRKNRPGAPRPKARCFWPPNRASTPLEVFQSPITCWEDLLQACAEIAEGKHDFKTIVIDTVDNAYKMCADYVCKKFKIEHESDLGYGKGYALINNEFQRVLNKLAFLPYGLILISHSQEKEIETRTGKHTRIVATLPDKARKMVTGLVDMILYCDLEMKPGEDGKPAWQRVMRTKPSPNYDAGDRTGRLPEALPLDFPTFIKVF